MTPAPRLRADVEAVVGGARPPASAALASARGVAWAALAPARRVASAALAPARRVASAALVLAVVVLAGAAAVAAAPAGAQPGGGPLALADASLEQRDVRMVLRLVTTGDWTSADLVAGEGRSLCVTVVHGVPARARGRLCVTRREARTALSYAPLSADGSPLRRRRLAAKVRRPAPGVMTATFLPAAADLPVGAVGWFASSSWTDGGVCATACEDRLPAGDGLTAAAVSVLAVAPCFGAAARDPRTRCANPALRLTATPSPRRAGALQESYCDKRERRGLVSSCAFGAGADEAAGTFALIGDSHAAGLKSALQVVTLAKRWRGVSIVRSGCPAMQGLPLLPTPVRSRRCQRWNRDVLAWLRAHREVDTVVLSAHAGARIAAGRRRGSFAATRAAYRAEIRALRRLGRRVVVIRDTPSAVARHTSCVAAAIEARRDLAGACTAPRSRAIRPDPLASAAASLRGRQVRLVDLTRHMCDARRCFAVVGGALVHRDRTHLTALFSATLGPYVAAALTR